MIRTALRLFSVALALALTLKSVIAAELTIDITGIRNANGIVRMAIFDKHDQFPKGQKLTSRNVKAAKAVDGALSVRFKDLAPGTYAIAFHHDENENREMDFHFFILPAEGYGFSNNARVIFSAPSFEAASFDLPKDKLTISVELRY